MDTKIYKIDNDNIDSNAMCELGAIIADGGLVAFPTETVYGLGADALNPQAVQNIFKAKRRPADNPLIVHFSKVQDIEKVCFSTPLAKLILDEFSPGPITVILKKKPCLSEFVTAGLDTVAVRIPSNETARALIEAAGTPIAAPSANLSGKPSPTTAGDVIEDMQGRIDAIIDGCQCEVGVESTVIDMTGDVPTILRPGGITLKDIQRIVPDAVADKHILAKLSENEKPKCPGMKYKHYAPKAEVFVVEGKKENISQEMGKLILENSGKKIGVLSMGENYPAEVIFVGKENKEYAKNLFQALRELDRRGVEIIFAEYTDDDEYGMAVRNRLYKAAANRVIHV